MNHVYWRASAFALLAFPGLARACASCGCSLSADAAMGYSAAAGWRLSLEYDFLNQNQLRSGHAPLPPAQVAAINSAGGDQEVERGTINRYLTLGISYSPTPSWTASLFVPYLNRSHTTFGNVTPGELTPANISSAHSMGLGDIKLLGSYQGFLPTHNLGIQWGVKVPSGRYGGQDVVSGATVGRHPIFFSNGPNAGDALDTSLQPGTGSTDLILGAYYYRPISQDFDAFINAQYQFTVLHALDQHNADFRPGNQETGSFGLRYEHSPRWTPQFQININHKSEDQGALADNTDSAGTVIYVSPGISAQLVGRLQVFAFLQRPVFSDLVGFQVFPHWSGSIGASYGF